MGAEASKEDTLDSDNAPAQIYRDLENACEGDKPDLNKYKARWDKLEKIRSKRKDLDGILVQQHNIIKWVRFAVRRPEMEWKVYGIKIARSFFHNQQARDKLARMEFVDSVLLITFSDELDFDDNGHDDGNEVRQPSKTMTDQQRELQLVAAKTIREMAYYSDFVDSLCSTSVLNFLCIVLNKIAEAVEIVTDTFVKLSQHERNLALLMQGAVGDILESFFKTVSCVKPPTKDEEERWQRNVAALSNCAETLGTLKKHNFQCQVDLGTIIEVFRYVLDGTTDQQTSSNHNSIPDYIRLTAEMSRLLYWICRPSTDVTKTLQEGADPEQGIPFILQTLVRMWKRSVSTHDIIHEGQKKKSQGLPVGDDYKEFCVDDLDRSIKLQPDSQKLADKIKFATFRLCFLNCLMWVLLPVPELRWKLKVESLCKLYLAFQLKLSPRLFEVVLGTVRHLADMPQAQECSDMIKFFGEQLLILLVGFVSGTSEMHTTTTLQLLLETISVLAMQRETQELLAEADIWHHLEQFRDKPIMGKDKEEKHRTELLRLRILGHVAVHPSSRLTWVSKKPDTADACYPSRAIFIRELEGFFKSKASSCANLKTIASILLTIFGEEKLKHNPIAEMEETFKSVLDWWQANTTARYQEEMDAADDNPGGFGQEEVDLNTQTPLDQLLQRAAQWKAEQRSITCIDTMNYCAPHECMFALALFSRLALEPIFKPMFDDDALTALLGCVCVGIWPEAREAAAVLANLMWLPDLKQEMLVCWLKFDSPQCVAADAANVLVPIKVGNPKGTEIGKGMYKSTWGVEFGDGTCVTLHHDGLCTYKVPGLLTSASPTDTYANTSRREYQWLRDEHVNPRHFTLTCWFYWPLGNPNVNNVLVQSKPPRHSQIYFNCEEVSPSESDAQGHWTLTDEAGKARKMKTHNLHPGWHMLALVSSTDTNKVAPFNGTKFFIDEKAQVHDFWVKNEFYVVGNDSSHDGKKPFGLITDFRIYARSLPDMEILEMVQSPSVHSHPDQIVTKLANMDAATILAQRLDCPDSAVECLRALGSLGTKASERAKIYSVCGREILRLLESPLPLVQRMASRLLNNIT